VSRVGLDYVKKKILDDHEGRRALWAELQFALDGEPDPWFDFDQARVDLRQFEPVAATSATAAAPSLASAAAPLAASTPA
jgi:nitrite reductase (NADH) large subunit